MRNGYVEGAADHTISVYTVSVPKCFGKPKQSATIDFLEFVNTDEDVILIVSFSKNDVSKQDFVERIERGILNLFQNGELTSSEEIKISGLLGRMLKATGNYSNQHVNATAAVALDENQQGTLSIILMQGENVRYDYYADFDFIVKSVSVTQRSATKQSTASGSQDSDTVSESVKGIMDGYEAFIDSYCEFMKKYSDSDDVAGLALEYIALLMNLSDWENKIDQIDEDSLSEADLMYYDKVMLRCATKLLQAAGD